MKKVIIMTLLMLAVLVQLIFAEQPKLKEAAVKPNEAAIGDTIKVTVEFTGVRKDIREVYLTVREYQYDYPRIPLAADTTCKKNIWAMKGPIPNEAPPELFHLDITAIDKEGKEIVTKGFEQSYTGKAGTIELKVK
ncbi:hypothetical protein JW964_19520 [candidate division KSB1 bacterium]|nr:hypothetical protein [candidate division KSB1 bacterium]